MRLKTSIAGVIRHSFDAADAASISGSASGPLTYAGDRRLPSASMNTCITSMVSGGGGATPEGATASTVRTSFAGSLLMGSEISAAVQAGPGY